MYYEKNNKKIPPTKKNIELNQVQNERNPTEGRQEDLLKGTIA
jgi:hypothetical protein